jgi:hypothetical protein
MRPCPILGLLLAALLGFLNTATAFAWDYGGHEITALVAGPRLNAKARAAVVAAAAALSIPGRTYSAVTLACWMDDLKKPELPLPDHGLFYTWHYIDLGAEAGDPAPSLTPGNDNPYHGDVVQALQRAQVVLLGGADPYIKTQAEAIALTMHLVGDIHQPLHAATHYFQTAGGWWHHDAGGNKEYVRNGPPGDEPFSLHRFWDCAWRANFDDSTGDVVLDPRFDHELANDPDALAALAREVEFAAIPSADLRPRFDDWARESNELARAFVYRELTAADSKKFCRLGSGYVTRARVLARQRLLLAGERLAALLNQTVGAPTLPPPPPSYPPGPPGVFDPAP